MSKPLVAFPWYGGKYYLRDRLYKHFPRDCKHYAEVFGGSAVLLLNLDPPFPIETYNDINSNVVNFFRVLREHTDELIFALELTPYSIEEYKSATPDHPDPIERARRFYICVRQGWNGIADNKATWRFNKVKSGGHTSLQWLNSFNKLWTVAKRLQFAQIENQDAIRFIDKYDTPQTFFYCDPPYVHDSRVAPEAYEYEMTNEQHIALGNRLNNIEGKAMVSGFHSKLYDELFAGMGVQGIQNYQILGKTLKSGRRDTDTRPEYGSYLDKLPTGAEGEIAVNKPLVPQEQLDYIDSIRGPKLDRLIKQNLARRRKDGHQLVVKYEKIKRPQQAKK